MSNEALYANAQVAFNMINEVDIEATEARIKEFQAANQDVILANHAKAVRRSAAYSKWVHR